MATQQGYREGLDWLLRLYSENLIDPECFTPRNGPAHVVFLKRQGRSLRRLLWLEMLPASRQQPDRLGAPAALPIPAISPRQNGSFTSGFGRGKCVVTAKASNPRWFVPGSTRCMPARSPQNNYGVPTAMKPVSISLKCPPTVRASRCWKHAPSAMHPRLSPRAQCVGGPLAVLDDYYSVYVTCGRCTVPFGLDQGYLHPGYEQKYVYPNVLSTEDTNGFPTFRQIPSLHEHPERQTGS